MRNSILFAATAAMILDVRSAGAVGSPTPGAVTAQTVKLPDGPGSVRGLASDAIVNAFTGQVAYQIPIELPGGPGGLAPKLALSYNGALGNGPLGLGWSLSQAAVRRSLRLGVPSYNSSDELELIGIAGATLVSIGNGQYRAEGQGNSIRGTAVDGGFELVDSAGTHYRLGTSDASRLQSGSKVAAWLLERVTDVAGHVIAYSYERRDGELYLTSIAWGGDGVYRADLVYENRPDTVVSWRTGFKVSAARRLTSLQLSAFGEIRNTVVLTYDAAFDASFRISRLGSVKVVGSDGTVSPVTTLGYATPAVGQAQQLTNTGGWSLGTASISFFDVDKDGAMDLLRVEPGNQRYRRNRGGSFGAEVPLANAPGLSMSSVRMLDLDGDSGAEMVAKSGSTWRSFRIVNDAWVATDWPGSSTLDLQSVAVADLNGDNRMDVLSASGSGISVWLGTSNGFASPRTLPPISVNEASITPNTVQFPDINGDGLADAVAINSNGLIEFRGRGDGTFERVGLFSYPWTGTTETTQIRLADLNRDGLFDLVRVGTTQVFWYRGRPGGSFAPIPVVLNRPPGLDTSTVVALADANGNGSTDVVWSSTNGMWALDLAGPTHAGLLVSIDNGLGKVQHFNYTASTQLAWNAEGGNPWVDRMPVSIAVTTTSTTALGDGHPDRTRLLNVRDGIYEVIERRFIGFQQSIETLPGTGAADTIRVITQFHAGDGGDRALRGQPLSVTTQDGAGVVFKLIENEVAALAIHGLPDDPRLKRAAVTQTRTTLTPAGEARAVTRTRFQYDDEGRQIEERRDGRVTDGIPLDGDESILRRTYTVEDATTGVRDLVCDEVLLDGTESVVSHTQRRFGDDTTVADLCVPGKGWVRDELGYLAEEDRWVSQQRTSYDTHGNPILVVAKGVQRTLGYDSHGLHPVSESVSPATGQTLTWTAEWDDVAGTLVRVAAPNGVTNQMTYDGLGRLTSIAANDGPPHTHYRYNWIAPRPTTETFTFDGDPATLGALPEPWAPGAGWRHTVAMTDGAGEKLLTAVHLDVDDWSIAEFRQRDHRGRVTAITSPFGYHGDLAQASPPTDAATQTLTYDPLDRVIDQVLPTGDHKRATYRALAVTLAVDGLAPVKSTLDGQGRVVHTERTVNGIVESVDAAYDAAGRIVEFRLQGDRVHHRFTYDSLGRLTDAVDPDVGPRAMQYNDDGQLVLSQNGAGETVAYSYDGAGRLLAIDGADVALRYHYDTARSDGYEHTGGQLAWVEEPTGSVDLGYDAFGRPSIQQRTLIDGAATILGREVTQYSPSGLARQVDLGDGVVLPLHYDAGGRLAQIEGVWSVESYNAAALPMRERFGNGVVQRYERDVLNRSTRIAIENPGGALYNVTASYNAIGAIATMTDEDSVGLDHNASFGYDDAGRLTAATLGIAPGAYQFSYAYDGLQNMIQRGAHGPTALGVLAGEYRYRNDAPRQLERIVDAGGATAASFAYDAAGRQIQHGDKHISYDALSHVIRVDGVAGGSVEHRYGYDGTRVSTRSPTGETTYWITPNVVVRGAERDHYVRVDNRVIAKITTTTPPAGAAATAALARGRVGVAGLCVLSILGLLGLGWHRRGIRIVRSALAASLALLVVATGCGTQVSSRSSALDGPARVYFHQAYSAGPELTTDGSGSLLEDRRTEPFGVAVDAFRDGEVRTVDYRRNPINALNKFSDPDTSWSFHGARWLAPDTAQWHTPDPPATGPDPQFMAQPWALHPYQYVNQNPVAYWDPDGRSPAATATAEGFFEGVKIATIEGLATGAMFAGALVLVIGYEREYALAHPELKIDEGMNCNGQPACVAVAVRTRLAFEARQQAYAQERLAADAKAGRLEAIRERAEAAMKKPSEPRVHLFRGVTVTDTDYDLAVRGIAVPRGIRGGHSDPDAHNTGDTFSQFTSWTRFEHVAEEMALDAGAGVVLDAWFPTSRLRPSPDTHREGEVYVKGTVTGASTRFVPEGADVW